MKKTTIFPLLVVCLLWVVLGAVGPAEATQVHEGAEGLYAHQIAHVFFAFSLGILIYWLRERKLVRDAGWRFVQYSAFFFILWNLDAILVHYLDGREDLFETINAGAWYASIHIVGAPKAMAVLYYIAKMDHVLCVPAVVFLYAGLRQLLKQAEASKMQEKPS